MSELLILKDTNLINSDKESILAIVDNYIEDVAHNGGDVLKDWTMCEKYGLLIEKIKESLKPYIIDEVHKYDRSEADMYNCNFKVVEAGIKYDFSNNPAWIKQKRIVDEETNKLKNIETFIKSLTSEASTLDETTGEITHYYPVTKTGKETIRTTIK